MTPTKLFFLRNHFAEPELSLRDWTLTIEGKVGRRLSLTFSDLLESPSQKLEALLECAGDPASGGGVSNGIWEGVPLRHWIEQARPSPGATHVLLEGSDSGRLRSGAPTVAYSRVVPLTRSMAESSLLALKLDGLLLPRRHGFPVRALLPGWYAMDSVKWLRRIVVLGPEEKPPAFYNSGMERLYTRLLRSSAGVRPAARVTEILVKSMIAYPADGATLPAGNHLVWGFAWTGNSRIRRVELSNDAGRSWQPARLESTPQPLTWVRWSYSWKAVPGGPSLLSRAFDTAGHEQPLARDPLRDDGYELNACAPVRCRVMPA